MKRDISSLTSDLSGLRVVHREVRGQGHVQLPWELVRGPRDLDPLTSALSDHQLHVLVVQDADEVALQVAVVHGHVVQLEDVPEGEENLSERRSTPKNPQEPPSNLRTLKYPKNPQVP